MTCHDGFTLNDLVSYNDKHNEANLEDGRDGTDDNRSWNMGVEGPTDDPAVIATRERQKRNFLATLFLSQGTPMLLGGDEMGRTQGGNNNAWCQDNEVGWLDWSRHDEGLLRFTRGLVALRRAHPALRRGAFLTAAGDTASDRPDVVWHGTALGTPDWGPGAQVLAAHLAGERSPEPDDDLYLAANAGGAPLVFELPRPPAGTRWLRVVATWQETPGDLLEPGAEEAVEGATITVPDRACVLLRSGRH